METTTSKLKNKPKTSPSPRRGNIKKIMMSKFAKSAASVVPMAVKHGRKTGKNSKSSLSSSFTTPKETPIGYKSEGHSDS
ncbi:hypothetical protein ACSBR2_032935 [Camellia fascicularis]